MEIADPVVLAKLPKFGLVDSGRVQCSQVWGITDGRKKKRHELCVAVDGNSVSVVETVNGKTLTSFPVPPDAVFAAKPYSLRTKVPSGNVQRITVCVLIRRNELVVHRFVETKDKEKSNLQSFKHGLDVKHGSVVLLDASVDKTGDIMVVQEDGYLTLLSDKEEQQVKTSHIWPSNGQVQIYAASCSSMKEAEETILKSRQDVVTNLQNDAHILTTVFKTTGDDELKLGVWALSSHETTLQSVLQPIVKHSLGSFLDEDKSSRSSISLHQDASRISIETHKRRISIDTTLIIPQVTSEIVLPTRDVIDSITISNSVMLVLSQRSLQLVNNKYGSILTSLDIGSTMLKRKRNNNVGGRNPAFVGYFPRLKRAVISRGNQLLAVDLLKSNRDETFSLHQSSLLIANIGRGADRSQDSQPKQDLYANASKTSQAMDDEWLVVSPQLDRHINNNDVTRFETLYKQTVSDGGQFMPKDASAIAEYKVDFLLSRIFQITEPTESTSTCRIMVPFVPAELIKWCAEQGLLTEQRLCKAWFTHHNISQELKFEKGALALALNNAQNSSELLLHYISWSPYLQAGDLTAIIQAILRDALSSMTGHDQLMLDNGQSGTSGDEENMSAPSRGGNWLASRPQDHETLPSHLSRILISACHRLSLIDRSRAFASLRSTLSQPDILALIQFLRQQLFQSGYTRFVQSQAYPTPPSSSDENISSNFRTVRSSKDELCLHDIITLLSICIDVLGLVGFMETQDNRKHLNSWLISELSSEIASATQALEESMYVQGILRETLRYTESVHKQHPQLREDVPEEVNDAMKPGTITTLYSEPNVEDLMDVVHTALPLDLRAEKELDKFRTRKGNGDRIERSTRELGLLRDRQRSSYSFERLIL